jgi:hypothetical protein
MRSAILNRMRFEREMAGVEEMTSALGLSAKSLGLGRQEEGIVPAPDRQERRPRAGEIFLEARIERDIGGVVTEQVELYLVIAGTGHQRIVEPIGFRRDLIFVGRAVDILPSRRLEGEQHA